MVYGPDLASYLANGEGEGEVLGACVTPPCIPTWPGNNSPYLEHVNRRVLQVCENNTVRQTPGVKRVNGRKMDDLREELCREILNRKIGEELDEVARAWG